MIEKYKILPSKICALDFKNPIIIASGTYGFDDEYQKFFDPEILGGISCKGLTLEKRIGNTGIRVHETPSGIMNSIGLQNPGIDAYIESYHKKLTNKNLSVLINLGGSTEESYIEAARKIEEASKHKRIGDALELNISCPNVKSGGMAMGMIPEMAGKITRLIKNEISMPLIVKLSPNAYNLVDVAKACEKNGADMISLVNTFNALDIDIYRKKAIFDNIYAGLSGPAIKPIALRMVRDVSKAVKIPIIGMGGISSGEDVIKFIMAGASLVSFGTASFINPKSAKLILDELREIVEKTSIKSIDEIRGII